MLMLISPGIIAAINFPIEVYFSWVRQIPFLMMNTMTIKNLQVQKPAGFVFPWYDGLDLKLADVALVLLLSRL